MAADGPTENFQGQVSFFGVEDFSKNFFKMSCIKFCIQIFNWFFSIFGAWHPKMGPKSKKWVLKQKKQH